jgi:hypothetical protein
MSIAGASFCGPKPISAEPDDVHVAKSAMMPRTIFVEEHFMRILNFDFGAASKSLWLHPCYFFRSYIVDVSTAGRMGDVVMNAVKWTIALRIAPKYERRNRGARAPKPVCDSGSFSRLLAALR